MTWTIIEKNIQATFACNVIITNGVWVTFKEPVNPDRGNQWLTNWLMPIEFIFSSMDDIGVTYPSQYTWSAGCVIYRVSGLCSASLGLTTTFDLEQKPLEGDAPVVHYNENVLPANLN